MPCRRRSASSASAGLDASGLDAAGPLSACAYDANATRRADAERHGISTASLRDALASEVVFYCVPISAFETTLQEHLPYFAEQTGPRTLIDTLSVKVHAREVFDRHLPPTFQAMLTHPMFGPDSVAVGGLAGQPIVLDRYRMHEEAFVLWEQYFVGKGLDVVVMSADEHDRLAAESQGVTHFVGRTLERSASRRLQSTRSAPRRSTRSPRR